MSKTFHNIVQKYTKLAHTKDMCQWCVEQELKLHLFRKNIESIKKEQSEKVNTIY